MAREFLHRLHASYSIPTGVIADVVKNVTGQDVTSHQRIVQGYANEVYRVGTRQGSQFIVRIQRHAAVGFVEEAWAMTRCRAAGAPVPEVDGVTTVDVDGQSHEIMILEPVAGRALSDVVMELTPRERELIFTQVGTVISTIHGIEVDGFGRLRPGGHWESPNRESYTQAILHQRSRDVPALIQAGLHETEVDSLLELLARLPTVAWSQPVLCHADLTMSHLFVDDQLNLTGVIDFGQWRGGPPALDFAVLRMYHPEVDLAWLKRGYQNQAIFDDTFPLQILIHQANMTIGYLGYDIPRGNTDYLSDALFGLRAILRDWQRFQSDGR
ncbi:MAG: phosphotransferase family protein [Chloroflexota bacterium]